MDLEAVGDLTMSALPHMPVFGHDPAALQAEVYVSVLGQPAIFDALA
jgi:hypothetical protein